MPVQFLLAFILATSGFLANTQASVDLHAHLFMDEGMSWMFHGGFDEPLKADSWKDRFYSKVNAATLNQSGFRIVVVSLYAHPLMNFSLRDSIHRQIDQAEAFVRKNPNWIIARNASQTEQALMSGRRVLVLSLETAAGILETENDLKTFIDGRGISIVTLLHLTGDHYGGVGFRKGLESLSTPFDFLASLFNPKYDSSGVRINPNGLTEDGVKIAQALLKRRVWIDLSHASDQTQKDLIPLILKAGQPLLYTHTSARQLYQAERVISEAQLAQVRESRGLVGLIPSEQMLGAVGPPDCPAGLTAMATHYRYISEKIGADSIMLGTDVNAPLNGLRPASENPKCPKTETSIDQKGYVSYGQTGELWKALRKVGAPVPEPLDLLCRRFVESWKKIRPH